MAALSVVFDGTALHTEPSGPYLISDPENGPDFGSQAVADALLTGHLRPEEIDQAAAELGLQRVVVLPLKIRASSADTLVTLQQALTGSLAKSSIYAPTTLTVTPLNSAHVSTFKVRGGSWTSSYTQAASVTNTILGTLTLQCQWPIFGVAQNLGSSGAPLISNTASPAPVTLAPSPTGDVPADVTLFVVNRSASAIRSLMVAGVGGNTTWVAGVDQSTWTLDTDGVRASSQVGATATALNAVMKLGHFTAPTLPSDRRFRVFLRGGQSLQALPSSISFRVRLTSGQTEVIGPWRSFPQEWTSVTGPFATTAADMGGFNFPVGDVGLLGAQSTTVFVEAKQASGQGSLWNSVAFGAALFMPEDGLLVVETSDTSKTLAAASGTIRIESDQAYDASGNPAGGAVYGSHIRTFGGRYQVYTSQGYTDSLDTTLPWSPENVDVYAIATPRYIGLA